MTGSILTALTVLPATKSMYIIIQLQACVSLFPFLQSDKADTANFLSFLKTLRQTLKSKKTLITAAVGTAPFNDENQQPSTKLDPEWAAATDGIYIMV